MTENQTDFKKPVRLETSYHYRKIWDLKSSSWGSTPTRIDLTEGLTEKFRLLTFQSLTSDCVSQHQHKASAEDVITSLTDSLLLPVFDRLLEDDEKCLSDKSPQCGPAALFSLSTNSDVDGLDISDSSLSLRGALELKSHLSFSASLTDMNLSENKGARGDPVITNDYDENNLSRFLPSLESPSADGDPDDCSSPDLWSGDSEKIRDETDEFLLQCFLDGNLDLEAHLTKLPFEEDAKDKKGHSLEELLHRFPSSNAIGEIIEQELGGYNNMNLRWKF